MAVSREEDNNCCCQHHQGSACRRRRKRRRHRLGRTQSGVCCGGSMRRLALVSTLVVPELIPLAARIGGDGSSWRRRHGAVRLAALAYNSQAADSGDGGSDNAVTLQRVRRGRARSGARSSLRRRAEAEAEAKEGTTDSDERGRSRQYLEGGFHLPRGGLPLNRIINGIDVTSRLRRPYAVHLGCCTGSLIAPDVVLTAAHCLGCIGSKARVGRYDLSDPNEEYEELDIVETYSHPLYDPPATFQDYDAAVCILGGMSKAKPVVLDGEKFSGYEFLPRNGEDLTVIGWGLTETGDFASILQRATVQYDKDCGAFGPWVTPRMMCAADHSFPIKDACEGDSGAPLLANSPGGVTPSQRPPLQVGILSWGERYPCNEFNKPAVYTRVREVHGWIESEVCSRSNAPLGRLVAQMFDCPDRKKENAGLSGGIFLGVETPGQGFEGDEEEENIGTLGGVGVEVVGQLEDLTVIIPAESIDVGSGGRPGEEDVDNNPKEEQQEKASGGGNKKAKNAAKKNTKNKQ